LTVTSRPRAENCWPVQTGHRRPPAKLEERAAIREGNTIAMGEDIERARAVLATTERRSLQLIYAKEFRFTSASKPQKPKPAPERSVDPPQGIPSS
jgi:hypothetical protein